MRAPTDVKQGNEFPGAWQTPQTVNRSWAGTEGVLLTLDIEHELGLAYGIELTGLSITRKDGTWRVTVKGLRHGQQLVAFLHVDHLHTAWLILGSFIQQRLLSFRPDAWATKKKKPPRKS